MASPVTDPALLALLEGGAKQPVADPATLAQLNQRSVIDKLTGLDGGERYQTWPERAVRGIASGLASGATLPGDVMAGKASPDDTGRVMELATMGTPVNPAIRAGDRMLPGMAKAIGEKKPVVPTTTELAEAGGKQFEAFRNSGVEYSANSVSDWARRTQQELFDRGISPVDAPGTFTKLKELENAPPGAFVTPANLHSLRQSLQATAQNFNPQAARDQLAASRGIAALDNFISAPPTSGVLAGTPPAAAVPFEAGKGNYAAAMRSNAINGELDRARTGILERSEGRAQAANSGRNPDNTIRSKAESFLEKPKDVSGLSDAEIAALEGVVEGGPGRNSARYIGNLLGGGGGMGQALWSGGGATAGALTGGPVGAAVGATVPPAIGAGAKALANILAKRDLRSVDEMMRMRSPLYEERVANPEMYVISPEKRALMARAALLQSMNQQ